MSDSLCSQFRQESKNCIVINPGNFKNSGYYTVINLLNLSSENFSLWYLFINFNLNDDGPCYLKGKIKFPNLWKEKQLKEPFYSKLKHTY